MAMQQHPPPQGVAPSALWSMLAAMPRPHRVVDFPRKMPDTDEAIGQVAIWPLTSEEKMISATAAEKFAKEKLRIEAKASEENLGYQAVFESASVCEVLWRACRRPEDLKLPAFPSPAELRKNLTDDELAVLFRSYILVKFEVGPIVAEMTSADEDAWIATLAKAGDALPLSFLSQEAHERLTLSLACRLASSTTGTASAGSPPDDGTSGTSAPDDPGVDTE
jgi:hypothetical protein